MAKRHQYLSTEISECDRELSLVVNQNAPALLEVTGAGVDPSIGAVGELPVNAMAESFFAHFKAEFYYR